MDLEILKPKSEEELRMEQIIEYKIEDIGDDDGEALVSGSDEQPTVTDVVQQQTEQPIWSDEVEPIEFEELK